MDRREAASLDRYITGNYGEDQFLGDIQEFCEYIGSDAPEGCENEAVWVVTNQNVERETESKNRSCDNHVVPLLGREGVNTVWALDDDGDDPLDNSPEAVVD